MEKEQTIINQQEKLYIDINPDIPISEIESLCMYCGENGVTRLLTTSIPFFKSIILMAFTCDKCGYKSSEVQAAESLADFGIKYDLEITTERDLSRRIVKTEFAELSIPYCNLEIPPKTQKGKLSTIEGFLTTARDDLKAAMDDGVYDNIDKSAKAKIQETIDNITKVLDCKVLPVKFTLSDPSGNSFVENPFAPNRDPYCKVTHFVRTKDMAKEMGYLEENQNLYSNENSLNKKNNKVEVEVYKSSSEFSAHLKDLTKSLQDDSNSPNEDCIRIPEFCVCCKKQGENRVCVITIPYFKELIISSFRCEFCEFKHSDVKGGGGISAVGTKITLNVTEDKDFDRDLFKSESSMIQIPELEFESSCGSLGSMFTTVEGLLDKISGNLKNTPFVVGDSSNYIIDKFINRLDTIRSDFKPFTLIIDDPLSNSFIFPIDRENPGEDKNLIREEYTRSWEQDEEFGLNQMNVDHYAEPKEKQT